MRTASRRAVFRGKERAGPFYLDASALAKIYFPEPESEELDWALRGRRDLIVSDLAITEIISALARRRREGSVTSEVVLRVHRLILADWESGVFRRASLIPETHRQAERFLLSSQSVSLRAADALHLALALAAGAVSALTYDRRLAEAARTVGVEAFPG